MFMTGGIEQRDFNMKMKKVTEFLMKGHPVKVSIVPKKFLKNNRFTKDGVKRDRMQGNASLWMVSHHLLVWLTALVPWNVMCCRV
jgi:hypothetical protein